jgi:hypothetical protein
MSSSDDPRNTALTGDAPLEPAGSHTEPSTVSAPAPQSEPPASPVAVTLPSEPSASQRPAGLASEPAPGQPADLRWCKRCEQYVVAVGKGKCPTCAMFLSGNTSAIKRSVNVAHRAKILADLIAEYRPSTVLLSATCEHLAAIHETLESLKAGSMEYQRLVQLSQTLGDRLEASRPPSTPSNFGNMTTAEIADEAKQVWENLRDRADSEAEGKAYLAKIATAPNHVDDNRIFTSPAGALGSTATTPVAQVATPKVATPVCEHCHGKKYVGPLHCATEVGSCPYCHQRYVGPPEPPCSYCGGRECVGPYHPAYSTLHSQDPVEIAARDREATQVMLKMMPFGTY